MDLGIKLQNFRHNRNYSQNKVAEILDVSQSTYCDWESNTIFPKAENLVKIADLYDVDIKELLPSKPITISKNPTSSEQIISSDKKVLEALLKVAESIDSLAQLLKSIMQENKKEK